MLNLDQLRFNQALKLKTDPNFLGHLIGLDYSDNGEHQHALISVAKPGETKLHGNAWVKLEELEA
jgi:hypothetical protein